MGENTTDSHIKAPSHCQSSVKWVKYKRESGLKSSIYFAISAHAKLQAYVSFVTTSVPVSSPPSLRAESYLNSSVGCDRETPYVIRGKRLSQVLF